MQKLSTSNATMGSISSILLPCKGKHSIKEVVTSVFLAHPITLDIFRKIDIESHLKGKSRKETINISSESTINSEKEKSPKQISEGIRYYEENNGEVTRLLQVINETNRYYISYHNLNYNRWNPFFEEYLNIIKEIIRSFEQSEAVAFSLHYIDEFAWNSDENIKNNLIFNVNSKYINPIFFESINPRLVNTSERLIDGNIFVERIDLNSDNKSKSIKISHNIINVLDRKTNLSALIESEKFADIMNTSHQRNKDFLLNLLTQEVCKSINLQ